MTLGTVVLAVCVVLWFLIGIQVRLVPGIEAFAHMLLPLGILLHGYPLGWWRSP